MRTRNLLSFLAANLDHRQGQQDEQYSCVHKPGTDVANLRSIGLQCPSAKTVAGLLRQSLLDTLLPLIKDLPQYAYAKSRGTFDAILRVHMHLRRLAICLRENQINRFQQPRVRNLWGA